MLISLGPWEQFGGKLWEHSVGKLLFLARNGLQNGCLFTLSMVNQPDEGLIYEARVFLQGHELLGRRDALRCHCSCSLWVSLIPSKHIRVPTKHWFSTCPQTEG